MISNNKGFSIISVLVSMVLATVMMLGINQQIINAKNQTEVISKKIFIDKTEEVVRSYLSEFCKDTFNPIGKGRTSGNKRLYRSGKILWKKTRYNFKANEPKFSAEGIYLFNIELQTSSIANISDNDGKLVLKFKRTDTNTYITRTIEDIRYEIKASKVESCAAPRGASSSSSSSPSTSPTGAKCKATQMTKSVIFQGRNQSEAHTINLPETGSGALYPVSSNKTKSVCLGSYFCNDGKWEDSSFCSDKSFLVYDPSEIPPGLDPGSDQVVDAIRLKLKKIRQAFYNCTQYKGSRATLCDSVAKLTPYFKRVGLIVPQATFDLETGNENRIAQYGISRNRVCFRLTYHTARGYKGMGCYQWIWNRGQVANRGLVHTYKESISDSEAIRRETVLKGDFPGSKGYGDCAWYRACSWGVEGNSPVK